MSLSINGDGTLTGVTAIGDVSSTELGYVDGVTSAIQTQLDAKAVKADGYQYRDTVYFTSSGTFSKASYPWLRAVRVRLVGGGGGGGGAQSAGGNAAGGGGGGGYSEEFITDISGMAASVTVTIGAAGSGGASNGGTGGTGGTSSFGAYCSATGGAGGVFSNGVGGSGGTGSGGDLNIAGSGGDCGPGFAPAGGSSQLGGGARGAGYGGGSGVAGGAPAGGYGGGGGGARTENNVAQAGGAGAAGIVIVELYA